jgi:hypothetical protein
MNPKRRLALLAFLGASLPLVARADRVAYAKSGHLAVESDKMLVMHQHDWSASVRSGTLSAIERESRRELFTVEVGALTDLWISPDSRYIVGLSNVKFHNPYQLVVFDASGKRLLALDMRQYEWARRWESVTNWIHWYKEPSARISISESGRSCTLTVEDATGELRDFEFSPGRD